MAYMYQWSITDAPLPHTQLVYFLLYHLTWNALDWCPFTHSGYSHHMLGNRGGLWHVRWPAAECMDRPQSKALPPRLPDVPPMTAVIAVWDQPFPLCGIQAATSRSTIMINIYRCESGLIFSELGPWSVGGKEGWGKYGLFKTSGKWQSPISHL